MTEQEEIWFEGLVKIREYLADAFELSAAVGVKNSVVEKYADEAHFVYELLQNADDAGAKKALFRLTDGGLYFQHDGVTRFTISAPDTLENKKIEKEDRLKGIYGHVNSICAIGNSSKKNELNKIGKFGVGFKSVFQYTNTPHIYDPNFKFKIVRFLVPIRLNDDIVGKNNEDTVFYFPFDKEEMPAEKAYSAILLKFKELVYPTLFLSNVQEVVWEAKDGKGKYTKIITQKKQSDCITYEKVELYQQIGLSQTKDELYLFSRFTKENNLTYSIGYFLDEKGVLMAKQQPAFCFFPTQEVTNLNFLLHAPFLLTDGRANIIRNEKHNTELVSSLAQLTSDSLLILKEIKLITDNITEIIPYKRFDGLFSPFYEAIKSKFRTEELLPASDGSYVTQERAYWAAVPKLAEIFSNEQLAYILDDKKNKWVFASKGRDEMSRGGDKELVEYIDSITKTWLNESDILTGWSQDGTKKAGISVQFIEHQEDEWLASFYNWLADTEGRKKLVKDKAFFLNQQRKAVPAFDAKNKLVLFLPDNETKDYDTLNDRLFTLTGNILAELESQQEKSKRSDTRDRNVILAKHLFEKFGFREYTVADGIEEAIEKFKIQKIEAQLFFSKAFKYFKNECPQQKIDEFIGKIKSLNFIPHYTKNGDFGTSTGHTLFYPTEKLVLFYEQKTDTKFANINTINKIISVTDSKTVDSFLRKLGVKEKDPELRDEVYNIILPQYELNGKPTNNTREEGIRHLKTLLEYYQKCQNSEVDSFLNRIKGLQFLIFRKGEEPEKRYWGKAEYIYYPSKDLLAYFETKSDTRFIDLEDYYTNITDEKSRQVLENFLLKIGVSFSPKILNREITDSNERKNTKSITGEPLRSGTSGYSGQGAFDKIFDGCKELIENIDSTKSLLLWQYLGKIKVGELKGLYKYYYRSQQYQHFESTTITLLKSKKWILSKTDGLVAPNEITINELAEGYDRNAELENVLCFKPIVTLSPAERIAQKFQSEEEAEEARKALQEKREREATKAGSNHALSGRLNNFDNGQGADASKIERTIKDLDDLQNEFASKQHETKSQSKQATIKSESVMDEDEELKKGIEDIKKQLELKNSRKRLFETISTSLKYSYDWFEAYLQLLTTYGEKQDTTKQKSISFQEIKPYKSDNKYFLLRGANTYISPEIENADDFKVSLVFRNGKKENIIVEGVSKKGQDLLIYCRESIPASIISRLADVFKVEINFTPVIDLLDRLYKAFTNRNYIDEWQNIENTIPGLNYIYGPPGTGKTTLICNNINEIKSANPNARFLILTPTNKAADVVCKKLLDINADIYAIRLSRPTDPELEDHDIYRDTLDADDMQSIDVVASTIHRLPYFDITNEGLLFQYKWDYVIFDEASMIGLHYITFALLALAKANSETHFIIAGDPKQIPPVVEINDKELENFDFQDENIYKMMQLESFNPKEQALRAIDTIENLGIQYRSVPHIGQLFNDLSYSSLLKHDRATNKKEVKPLPELFKSLISSSVTFIDVPLNQDDPIYRVNKLFYSSYHTYCGILVSEIIKYLDSVNSDTHWTVGLIAPYKAQAILLNKLITSYGISEKLRVFADTVHGFQGDECDIVFFVCNPNGYRYSGHEKALLSKQYIYNVAISRAKDYLVILHPYTAIPDNTFINQIGFSYKNNFGNAKIVNAHEIETTLFTKDRYIESNSYVSGHDSINVFGLSEMKYFIKANDTAIDIQLRDIKEE